MLDIERIRYNCLCSCNSSIDIKTILLSLELYKKTLSNRLTIRLSDTLEKEIISNCNALGIETSDFH